jgi:hypothetical protein
VPYIRVDVDVRTDPRWHDASGVVRAQAKALYLDAISYSGELLTDGHVSATVMAGLAAELGIKRPGVVLAFLLGGGHETAEFSAPNSRERVQKSVSFSPLSGHLSRTKSGYFIREWERFHDSRSTVQKRRTQAAERKQRSRAQGRLPMSHGESRRDVTPKSQRDIERDSRGRVRTREVEEEVLPKAVALGEDPKPSLDDEPEPSLDPDEPGDTDAAYDANGTAWDLHTLQTFDPLRDI